jgi:hypothetical protein
MITEKKLVLNCVVRFLTGKNAGMRGFGFCVLIEINLVESVPVLDFTTFLLAWQIDRQHRKSAFFARDINYCVV